MLTKRIAILLAACIVGLSCGTNYVYSAYAPQLAFKLSLTSVQTNIVGAAGNLGVYLSGPIIGRQVDRNGPTRMLLTASVLLFCGYFGIRAFYDGGDEGLFASLGLPGLILVELLTGVGSTAGLSAVGNSVAKSFKKTRATALSAVLSAFGLSAFCYSTIRRTLLHKAADPTSALLLFLAIGTACSMLFGAIFVRPVLKEDNVKAVNQSATLEEPQLAAVVEDRPRVDESRLTPTERTPLMRAHSSGVVPISVSGFRLLKELDFWLLFMFNMCTSSIGLAFINNLGSVTKSLAPRHMNDAQVANMQASLVSLLSLANCLGRLSIGFLSDVAVHRLPRRFRFSRVWWNVWTACLFAVSQILASQAKHVSGAHGLALPTIVTGFAHGSLFGTSGVLVLERFGMSSFSSNNGILALAPAIGGQLTNYMFGRIYDSHVPSHSSINSILMPKANNDKLCTAGRECFAAAFHITTILACVAICVAFVLVSRKSMKRRAA